MEKYRIDFGGSHTKYKNNKGEEVIGVTTALGQLEKYGLHYYYWERGKNGIPMNAQDPAALVGTIIHAKIMCMLGNTELDKSNITPEQDTISDQCMQSYLAYIKDKELKPILLEKSLVSNKHNYGGTPDFIGIVNKSSTELWDYKSSKDIYEDYIPQLIGYAKMAIENKVVPKFDRLVIVNIPKTDDGNFKVASYDMYSPIMEYYFQILLKCVELKKIYNDIKIAKKG